MKKLTLLLFVPIILFSQDAKKVESFKVTKESPSLINQFVVIDQDEMPVEEGYKRVIDWINITYNTPKEVIKGQIENDYIRIEGYQSSNPCIKSLGIVSCFDNKYSISFEFKENKIKFQVTRLQLYSAPSSVSAGGWSEAQPNYAVMYKKNGKPVKLQHQIADGFTSNLNALQSSLSKYVSNPIDSSSNKDDDW
tara:strand:+ start:1898 stop:2479 length:582 start_codon:yes stop_codon:yes gene_type:complete